VFGRRLYIAGFRIHHGLAGVALILGGVMLGGRMGVAMIMVGLVLVVHDRHDAPWPPLDSERP
jgi:hypothetical protein